VPWIKAKTRMPKIGVPVLCKIRNFNCGEIQEHKLIHVKEDDVVWRTADDHSELNEWNWDVEEWFENKGAIK
jgi:hypothetical protein